MSRFLFVVPPLTGHVNPTVAVANELTGRGHAVAWTAHPAIVRPLLPDGADLLPVGADLPDDVVDAVATRAQGLRGAAALKFLWDDFLHPLATSMVPGVEDAIERYGPDVVVVDQQAVAGAVVARQWGLRWATSATTSAEFADPLQGLPRVAEWVREGLVAFQLEQGVPESRARQGDLRFSDHLVLAFTTAALVGDTDRFPPHYAFVGPSIGDRQDPTPFPFDWFESDQRHVLVSLGTVNQGAGARFYRVAVEALDSLEGVQTVVVAPDGVIDGPVPGSVLVRPRVPQVALLPHLDAVVSHAGHNTVCEALAHGVPLVVAPIRDDQPVVASQVEAAGAAVRVKFGRVQPPALAAAVTAVLDDPTYGAAARQVQASFESAGGAVAAARRLEALAGSDDPPPTHPPALRTAATARS